MTYRIPQQLRRFLKQEEGSATVEFAIIAPLLMIILFSTVELGLITVKQSMLERALDITTRDIRLGTGEAPQHDEIRNRVCERTVFVNDCESKMRLEMIQFDPFLWSGIDPTPDCTTSIEDVQPVRNFVNGQSNELMYLRACMKIDPIFPHWGLGGSLSKDSNGRFSLQAVSAFVQEPV